MYPPMADSRTYTVQRSTTLVGVRDLDRESVYTRFFRYVSELSEEDLRRATETDPEREVALVVTVGSGGACRITNQQVKSSGVFFRKSR